MAIVNGNIKCPEWQMPMGHCGNDHGHKMAIMLAIMAIINANNKMAHSGNANGHKWPYMAL